ncbi:phage tail sheath family protein [Dendronalium sp. ChiSLP03b]|uniref:phage tail sheath family protein n=1 Tax=Dendronalium sp. ChiSLP03b TaxID=3075381 RepID=UPI002AD4CAEB|nr:phage tail sheath family protein [Dendronalium sp. ChiSLP03b]MDZ8203780.1 phage tail sheath family protein [Dendronalium sp. ChiSLP03b]
MPSTYKTPGVYIEEISKFPPSIAEVATAIPAFIGYTQKAIIDGRDLHAASVIEPKRITSLLEYEQYFGTAEPEEGIIITIEEQVDGETPPNVIERKVTGSINQASPHNMYYALQAYFKNGGGPGYIVSVGSTKATGGVISASALQAGIAEVAKEDEVTLFVFPESQALSAADRAGVFGDALNQSGLLKDRFVIMDMQLPATGQDIEAAAGNFRDLSLSLDNLKYGAVYTPNIETIFNYQYEPSTVTLNHQRIAPDSTRTAGSFNGQKMSALATSTTDATVGNAILFNLVKAAVEAIPLVLPPSPLVAGQYAAVDSTRGVFKAPANVALSSVIKPTIKITNAQQENLNVHTTGKSINAIRAFTGKGTLIWGARTLAGNDNEWRYVPVRRFFNMAEESIKKATEAFVFEPNDANTWVKVRAMIENFLILQWRAGALAGAKPEQAFYVRVGLNETMTALDILEGRMIIEIGMAVVRPAEFIILKFSHKMQES